MADNRLDPDINLLGYWGFDEALETDPALDGATSFSPADLTVTSAIGVQSGRVGSARDFNGTTSFAAVTVARLRLLGPATFMGWCKLDSFNSSGSLLRTVLSCGGPTTGDNLLYSVSVDSSGRLVYKHNSASGMVIVRTAVGLIKTAQLYCIMVRRVTNGPDQDIEFVVDNVQIPVASVTVNGVGSALPVPPPSANASSIFSVARSQKETDSAFWDGLLDEVSVHDIARPYQPYLRATYYRVALRNVTTHLTSANNVLAVSSADMGAGLRWWCYERDKDLYVVKESPLGVFGTDTRLTSIGSAGSSTGSEKPELIYDVATDTLLVLFVSGNRVFKLTASSTDDPATLALPGTADTAGIIKSLDNVDGGALGNGGGQRQPLPEDITYVNRTPIKLSGEDTPAYDLGNGGGQQATVTFLPSTSPTVNFVELPTDGFGLAIGPNDGTQSGYRVFRMQGGASQLLGSATFKPTANFYFFALSPIYGDVFYAEALKFGQPTGAFSNAVTYRFFEPILEGNVYKIGREGDGTNTMNAANGGGQQSNFDLIAYINRTPVKISSEDFPSYDLGNGGGQGGRVNTSGSNRPGGNPIEVDL